MNLALFVTKENARNLGPMFERMAELQEEPVNGALVVMYDSQLNKEAVSSICLPLGRRFKLMAALAGQLNSSHSTQAHVASLMSVFLRGAYTRFPGPWLLFDEPALPTCRNFMQEALRQHGAFGGRMSGRAVLDIGSALPVGPVTMELPIEAMKIFRYPSVVQGWRDRGRHIFARAGFQLVPSDQWLFTMKPVELTQPETGSFRGVMEMPDGDPPPPFGYVHREGVNPAYLSPGDEGFDWNSLSDQEIIAAIKATGKKPHHFTGRDKLLQMARELIQTPA